MHINIVSVSSAYIRINKTLSWEEEGECVYVCMCACVHEVGVVGGCSSGV